MKNMNTFKRRSLLFGSLLCILFIGVENGSSSSVEFKRLEFRKGYPEMGEPVDVSLRKLDRDQLYVLNSVVTALNARHDFGVKVAGHADSNECTGLECRSLSERRALIAYKWLQLHGLALCQLKGPIGESIDFSADPTASASRSNEDRQFNRRVQFNPFLTDGACSP